MNIKAHLKGSEGATVITFFQDKGIPAVATGYGTEGVAHITDEYIKIDTLYRGTQLLEQFIKDYDRA
jgi:acetylornithine deacetylase/succinyl-diaminopimelate desuccinylase-like protein